MGGAPSAESVDLSIIIVSWNVRQLLQQCLLSIAADRSGLVLQVIVVDAASADGTPEMVREQFPWVHLIACEDNVGFPRGNNLGLKESRGRYVLLLNPDTRVIGGALLTMTDYLHANPTVGVVGPQLLYPDGEIQSSRRRFPTLLTAFFESTWLEPWAPRSVLNHYRVAEIDAGIIQDVDWVMGAALMTRQKVVQQVGPLDEAYFMYSEELDWCRRMRACGWRVVYLPQAQVIHYEGKSSEQAVTARHINFQRAKLRYYRKYHGRTASLLLRIFLLLMYVWQLGLESVKGLLGHRRALRWQRVRAYWDVLRSGLHPAGY
ncbi:MAG: glycosyltransferase family 2 protein [Chloroflexota bacterium]